jgi:hypothetical protein
MNNSPYIQAYEAGIKLAVAQHFSKVAKDGDTPQVSEAEQAKLDAAVKARDDKRVAANDEIDATMPDFAVNHPRGDGGGAATTQSDGSSFLDNLGRNLTSTRDAIGRGLSSAGDAISSSIPTAAQASNFLEGAGDLASGAGDSLMAGLTRTSRNVSDYFNQEAPAPKQPDPTRREGTLPEVNFDPNRGSKYKMEDGPNTTAEGTFKSDFGDNDPTMGVHNRGSVTTPKQPDPSAQSQRFGRPSMARDANRSFNLGGDLSLNMDNFALPTPQAPAAPAAPAPSSSNNFFGLPDNLIQRASQLGNRALAALPAALQQAHDEVEIDGLLEDDAARGNVEDDQTFGAVRGGYGKQLRALRGMEGLSGDARDLLGQTNYRQLASAMGDRGLRVGDQFNVQDLLGRLRGQQARRDQEAGGGGSIGSTAAPIQIQNRRGRDVSRGAMTPRPAAPRPPTARPNVKSMVNQLGISPSKPFNLGPAPTEAELLRSVGANPTTPRPQRGQDLMGSLQGFPSNIGQF